MNLRIYKNNFYNHLFRGKNKNDEKVEGDISSSFEDFHQKK